METAPHNPDQATQNMWAAPDSNERVEIFYEGSHQDGAPHPRNLSAHDAQLARADGLSTGILVTKDQHDAFIYSDRLSNDDFDKVLNASVQIEAPDLDAQENKTDSFGHANTVPSKLERQERSKRFIAKLVVGDMHKNPQAYGYDAPVTAVADVDHPQAAAWPAPQPIAADLPKVAAPAEDSAPTIADPAEHVEGDTADVALLPDPETADERRERLFGVGDDDEIEPWSDIEEPSEDEAAVDAARSAVEAALDTKDDATTVDDALLAETQPDAPEKESPRYTIDEAVEHDFGVDISDIAFRMFALEGIRGAKDEVSVSRRNALKNGIKLISRAIQADLETSLATGVITPEEHKAIYNRIQERIEETLAEHRRKAAEKAAASRVDTTDASVEPPSDESSSEAPVAQTHDQIEAHREYKLKRPETPQPGRVRRVVEAVPGIGKRFRAERERTQWNQVRADAANKPPKPVRERHEAEPVASQLLAELTAAGANERVMHDVSEARDVMMQAAYRGSRRDLQRANREFESLVEGLVIDGQVTAEEAKRMKRKVLAEISSMTPDQLFATLDTMRVDRFNQNTARVDSRRERFEDEMRAREAEMLVRENDPTASIGIPERLGRRFVRAGATIDGMHAVELAPTVTDEIEQALAARERVRKEAAINSLKRRPAA